MTDWVFHALCLFWKVLFAFTPVPSLLGGWLCFWAALSMIGVVTAIVGDMAGLLGCCMGIPDDITAITLVALGTSLPDTFASKVAAQQNDTADDSIGNVTGSNCVNVFLGLGLPWTIGALYWAGAGRNQVWMEKVYKGKMFKDTFYLTYPDGGFIVPAGSLVFSVMVFTVCALTCVFILILRRNAYGGELGGPKAAQTRDSGICVSLWCLYIGISIIYSVAS
jgi:solute carrier family 8 (sodium/calcium exchanger)